jgi:hypothetical protein
MRTLAALLWFGLAGCGIYGPPERPAPPETEERAAAEPVCEDPEEPR